MIPVYNTLKTNLLLTRNLCLIIRLGGKSKTDFGGNKVGPGEYDIKG